MEGYSSRVIRGELPCQTQRMSLSCVAYIKLVVTQKSFAKCWRVMFAGRLLRDFRTVLSTWALAVCFVIFLVASSQTLTNSSPTAPSFSSQANASSLSAPIRDVREGPAKGSPLVSLTCGHCKTGRSFGCSSVPIPFSLHAPWQIRTGQRPNQGIPRQLNSKEGQCLWQHKSYLPQRSSSRW